MFPNIFIALAAVGLLALGASAVIPTSAIAYYNGYRDCCSNPPHFSRRRFAEEGEEEQEHHDEDEEHHDGDEEHHDGDEEHHDQGEKHHDENEEHHDENEEHHDDYEHQE
jgi:hypothetical protein